MKVSGLAAGVLFVAGLALAACSDQAAPPGSTAVPGAAGAAPLTDAKGQPIPRPPAPAGTPVQFARSSDENALALWEQDGQVLASSFSRSGGWSEARPLEQIYGRASDPQLASNGRGVAMALWRHTVGSIQSLRFSRFDASEGWNVPDVVPGALPQPHVQGGARHDDAPSLSMDAEGNATARWPSGFADDEVQSARHTPGQGWSRAVSEAVAQAPGEAPPPSMARAAR